MRQNKSARRKKSSQRKSHVPRKQRTKSREYLAELCPVSNYYLLPKKKYDENASNYYSRKTHVKRTRSFRQVRASVSTSPTEESICSQSVIQITPSISVACYTKSIDTSTTEKYAQTPFPEKQYDYISWLNNYQPYILSNLLSHAVSLGKERTESDGEKKLKALVDAPAKYDVAWSVTDGAGAAPPSPEGTRATVASQVHDVRNEATSAQMEEPLLLEAGAQTSSPFPLISCDRATCPSRVAGTQTKSSYKKGLNSKSCSRPKCPLRSTGTQTAASTTPSSQPQSRQTWPRNSPSLPPQPQLPISNVSNINNRSQDQMWQQSQSASMQQPWNWQNGTCTCCTRYGQPSHRSPICPAMASLPPGGHPQWEGMNDQSMQFSQSNYGGAQGWNSQGGPGFSMAPQNISTCNVNQQPNQWSQHQSMDEYRAPSQQGNMYNCICNPECEEPQCGKNNPCPFTDHVSQSLGRNCSSYPRQMQNQRTSVFSQSTCGGNSSVEYSVTGATGNEYFVEKFQQGVPRNMARGMEHGMGSGMANMQNGMPSSTGGSLKNASMQSGMSGNATVYPTSDTTFYSKSAAHPNDQMSRSRQSGSLSQTSTNVHNDSPPPVERVRRGSKQTNPGSRRVSLKSMDSDKESRVNGATSQLRGDRRTSVNSDTQDKIEGLRSSMRDSIRETVRSTMNQIAKSLSEEENQGSTPSSHTDSEKEREMMGLFDSLEVSESARNSILSALTDINRESQLEKAFEKYGISSSARNSILSTFSLIDREIVRDSVLVDASESARNSILSLVDELNTEIAREKALEGVSDSRRSSILSELAEKERSTLRQSVLQDTTDSARNSILSYLSELDLDVVLAKALEECSESARNSILSTFEEIDKDEAILKALEGASESARNSILSAFAEIDKEEALTQALEGLSESARNSILSTLVDMDRDEALMKALEGLSESTRNSIMSTFSEMDKDEALMKALEGASESTRNSILASFSDMDKEDALAHAFEGLDEDTRNYIISSLMEVDKEMGDSRDYSYLTSSAPKVQDVNYTYGDSDMAGRSRFIIPEGWEDCAGGQTACCEDTDEYFRRSSQDYEYDPLTVSVAIGPSRTGSGTSAAESKFMGDTGRIPDCRLADKKKTRTRKRPTRTSYETCAKMLCNERNASCKPPKSTKKCFIRNKASHRTSQFLGEAFSVGTQIDMM